MDPGDVALMTDPAYPVYPTAVALAGGESYPLPLVACEWLAARPECGSRRGVELARARSGSITRTIPRAPSAPRAFFAEAVAFARRTRSAARA